MLRESFLVFAFSELSIVVSFLLVHLLCLNCKTTGLRFFCHLEGKQYRELILVELLEELLSRLAVTMGVNAGHPWGVYLLPRLLCGAGSVISRQWRSWPCDWILLEQKRCLGSAG